MTRGARAALLSAGVLALAGLVGLVLHQPWVFPGLGPTLLVLTGQPTDRAAAPRHVLVGHGVAVLAGSAALAVTGLRGVSAGLTTELTGRRVLAAGLALGLTALVLHALDCPQPAAGATTLVVSLGLLTTPVELATILLSVVLVLAVSSAATLLARSSAS
ncbi:MAG TPA: HPP family protein [Mycobacteriales bacterium]|nr:HPP family protein [Mycobacteriales bacterium]